MAAQSRKPAPPAKADVLADGVTFAYDGENYAVPPTNDWPIDALAALEAEKVVSFVRLLLGESQWEHFRRNHSTVKHLNEMTEALQEAAGLGN